MPPRQLTAYVALLVALLGSSSLPAAANDDTFRTIIAPLLAESCGTCHGPDNADSGFRIDLRERAVAGGDSGAAGIVPGDAAASEIFRRIASDDEDVRMPADGEPLTAEQQALLRRWIDEGAVWPDDVAALGPMLPKSASQPNLATTHWSFQPLVRPPVPAIDVGSSNPLDAFIAVELRKQGLAFNPEADRRTLIRRVTFDLIGLPPTPEEIDAFLAACDTAGSVEQPYAALVDRLLESPRYGERWARHWLDVVRFAESHGFEMNQMRPNAWPYRDWVIDAFNRDMPYDMFVRRQLAGDAMGDDAATGFLVGGAWDQVKSPDPILTATQRADELHDMVSTTGSAFLGLTVGCARCHDHKFDPVPQQDYYALTAVVAGVEHGERPLVAPQEQQPEREQQIAQIEDQLAAIAMRSISLQPLALVSTDSEAPPPQRREAVVTGVNVDAFAPIEARFIRMSVLGTSGAEPCIDELEVFNTDGRNVAIDAIPSASGTYPDNAFHKLEHINDGIYGNEKSWISNEVGSGWVQLELPEPQTLRHVVWSRDRSPLPKYRDRLVTAYTIAVSRNGNEWTTVATHEDRRPFGTPTTEETADTGLSADDAAELTRLAEQTASLQRQLTALTSPAMVYAGTFRQPGTTHRLFRGDPMQPREEAMPGSLSRIGTSWQLPPDAPEQQRRKAFAEWIASAEHPLTPRVIVNRLWHYHFGTGLVDTPSDLGVNGSTPSHPDLLNWLACELIDPTIHTDDPSIDRWRLKRLHRLIVTSRTYRQASTSTAEGQKLDAGSRLLWRYPPQRLEAEALRDAILAVSGSLNLTMGGPGFDLFVPNTNYVKVYETKTSFTNDDFRRMVYQSKPRSELDTFFGVFDCPDAAQTQPARTVSTTPLQALNMLNGDFLLDQADRFAERLKREEGTDPGTQVDRAFALAFGRPVTPAERSAALSLIDEHGLHLLCRSLYNASEFITVR
ncbi:MAG: DUF1553 domain-containing protein [Pirellulales bacterium]